MGKFPSQIGNYTAYDWIFANEWLNERTRQFNSSVKS